MNSVCLLCGEKPVETGVSPEALCSACVRLLDWFRGHFADKDGTPREEWINAGTTFHELSIESLDYVEWLVEAEERFGVVIPDAAAERIRTVGEYLGYLRSNMDSSKQPKRWSPPQFGGSNPMWDGQFDG